MTSIAQFTDNEADTTVEFFLFDYGAVGVYVTTLQYHAGGLLTPDQVKQLAAKLTELSESRKD